MGQLIPPDGNQEGPSPRSTLIWIATQRWLWRLALCAAFLLQLPFLVAAFWPPPQLVADFYQDWASARNWREGLPIYTEHVLTIPRYVGDVDPICYRNTINAHPPTSVLLAIPLARLSYRPALLIWNLAGLLLLGWSLAVVGRELDLSLPPGAIVPALTLLLLCRPLVQQFFLGQLNLVLLALLTGAWAAQRSGRSLLAGAMIGTATAVKLFPAFLFLGFLAKRDHKALMAGSVTLASLTGLTMAVLGPDVYISYFRDVIPAIESFRSSWFNASLVGFWTRLFDPATDEEHVLPLVRNAIAEQVAILVSWLAVVYAVGWGWLQARTLRQSDHAFGATIAGMLLLSPVTWDAAFLLLLVPVAVLWQNPPQSRPARVLLVACLTALWVWQKPICEAVIAGGGTQGLAVPWHSVSVLAYPCYALIVLLIFLVQGAIHDQRSKGTA